jgi:predicted DNA-binding protein with PD1-like motif
MKIVLASMEIILYYYRMLKKLIILFVILLAGQGLRAQDEYVKPGQVVAKNAAPGMKFKLLSQTGKGVKTYAVILNRGDDVLSGLTQFADSLHITFAHFTGIGAVSSARLGCYDRDKQMYHIIPVKGQAETVSFIGNIALFNNKPVVHIHMAVSQSDGVVKGGHVFNAIVWPTLEIVVTIEPAALHKKKEQDTGFALIDPEIN